MKIVTKTNTGTQALRRRICGTIFVRYCLKMIFGAVLVLLIIAVFCYFLGFISNLFKALDSKPFIVPSPDILTAYNGLSDWNYLGYALAVVGVIMLIILFVVLKSKFDSRNQDERNFSVSEKGTYGTAKYLSEKQAKKLMTADGSNYLFVGN